MNGLIKSLLGDAGLYRYSCRGKAALLTYHRVLPGNDIPCDEVSRAMTISQDAFEAQIKFLLREFDVVSERELLDALSSDSIGKRRLAFISFDDGWRDTSEYAAPILEAYNVPATVFLSTASISSERPFWWELAVWLKDEIGIEALIAQLAAELTSLSAAGFNFGAVREETFFDALKRVNGLHLDQALQRIANKHGAWRRGPSAMDWNAAERLAQAGFALGPHAHDHVKLPTLSDEEIIAQIKQCRAELERRGLLTSRFFCYPDGAHDARVKNAVRACGCEFALALGQKALNPRSFDPLALPRINVGMHNSATLARFKWLLARAGALA